MEATSRRETHDEAVAHLLSDRAMEQSLAGVSVGEEQTVAHGVGSVPELRPCDRRAAGDRRQGDGRASASRGPPAMGRAPASAIPASATNETAGGTPTHNAVAQRSAAAAIPTVSAVATAAAPSRPRGARYLPASRKDTTRSAKRRITSQGTPKPASETATAVAPIHATAEAAAGFTSAIGGSRRSRSCCVRLRKIVEEGEAQQPIAHVLGDGTISRLSAEFACPISER